MLSDPVSTVAGKHSAIAQINKMAVDPGGVVMRADNPLLRAGVSERLVDPYSIGDAGEAQQERLKKQMSALNSQNKGRTTLG